MSALSILNIFECLHDAGLTVSLVTNGGLGVSPASRLTDDLRALIRDNKPFLLDWLTAANDPDPAPEKPADPNAWRELAQAYHEHHFVCGICIAAGRGSMYGLRCGTGAALRINYQNA